MTQRPQAKAKTKPLPAPVEQAQTTLALALQAPVSARAMFGGYGLYCEDVMIGGFMPTATGERAIMLRVDALSRQDFLDAGGEPFIYTRNGVARTMPYISLPDAILQSPQALAPFAEQALRAARAAKKA